MTKTLSVDLHPDFIGLVQSALKDLENLPPTISPEARRGERTSVLVMFGLLAMELAFEWGEGEVMTAINEFIERTTNEHSKKI